MNGRSSNVSAIAGAWVARADGAGVKTAATKLASRTATASNRMLHSRSYWQPSELLTFVDMLFNSFA